ncbi:Bud site selection protein 6 [Paecilomyces lecythidis]
MAPFWGKKSANLLDVLCCRQPDKQLSQIEKSVTHLLVATKQLLETLTQWSRKQASENEVSDVYVRLGYEFNLACRAFGAIGVDTSDLGPVPDLLRTILEDTLSQDASPQSLDRYLPRIRDIIINLLHGLKKKQARLRSRQTRDDGRGTSGRQASASSVTTSQSQLYDEMTAPTSPRRQPGRRFGSNGSVADEPPVPPRTSSAQSNSYSEREASRREAQKMLTASESSSSLSSATMQNLPVQSPYAENESRALSSQGYTAPYPAPPPPPPPKQDDALGALQRSGELERRASRRFSAYQIQKHLGTSPSGVPMLPSQNSPLPNRGKDVRESLNAVRLRGSYAHGKSRSTSRLNDPSPSRSSQSQPPPSIAEEGDDGQAKLRPEPAAAGDSSTAKPSEDAARSTAEPEIRDPSIVGGSLPNLPRPPEESSLAEAFEPSKSTGSDLNARLGTPTAPKGPPSAVSTPPHSQQFTPEQSPSPGKELTLFLQYKSKIKKYVLPEGPAGLTIGRLQLAFIEKFAWNTHNNGADLPEIYIQDPVSGVRHELEDLNDVKDRSVLVLNVEALDEVKKHFDDGLGNIRRLIEGVKGALDGQESMMQRVSDRQLEAAKEMARLAAAPVPVSVGASKTTAGRSGSIAGSNSQLAELQSLRRDLAVLRQTYSSFSSDISASMNSIRSKASSVKTTAADMAVPSFEGDAGRARVNAGKKELADESERLVARVDDLQDLVEDLRKDVVSRGVRPLPRQLEGVGKDISAVTKELKKMQDFLKREKPIWTKIWEKELQLVCEERDQLTMQEDLAADLEDDLEKAAQTFALVEQATKQQSMQPTDGGVVLRSTSRNLAFDQAVDPVKAKDNLLGEVRALQPNHESRLEAIERAEKARQKELENRRIGLFQKELGNFVAEGKLKKSGGVEETERLRKAKDDRIRKEVWERQQARAAEMERMEQEAAQATASEETKETTEDEPDSEQKEYETEPTEASDTADDNSKYEEATETIATEESHKEEEPAKEDKRADSPGE